MKFFASIILTCCLSVPAFADPGTTHFHKEHNSFVPVTTTAPLLENAITIRLTPDKSEIIHLEEDAASIILGNPVHASVLMDTPRLLVVVPKVPGATHFSVLNSGGQVIYERNVIVASPKSDYIRVRKGTCGEGVEPAECVNTQVYYCPDMCHGIMSESDTQAAAAASETAAKNEEINDAAQILNDASLINSSNVEEE